jgi:hypothetical protein
MKKILLPLFFILPLFSICQELSEVIEVKGKTADQLYSSAREWFALTFKSANDVLQMDDPIAGKLIGKGSTYVSESYVSGKGLTAIPITLEWYPNFSIKVEVREGRYKCDISDITITSSAPVIGTSKIPFQNYLDNIDYYENGSDPEWLTENPPQGIKLKKAMAKNVAMENLATLKMIRRTQEQIKALMNDLKTTMIKQAKDDW